MKASGVVALVAAGVVAGGGIATANLLHRPGQDRVVVDVVTPAAQTTPTSSAATVKPTATRPAVKTVTVTKRATAVPSRTTTERKATVQRQEATVSEPKPEPTRGPNAPRKGPREGVPGSPAPTGVFGGTSDRGD